MLSLKYWLKHIKQLFLTLIWEMVVEVENNEKTSAISWIFRITDEHLAEESNVSRRRKAKPTTQR